MDDDGLDTGFRGRELWREGLSSKFKEDKMSDTSKVKRWCGRAAAGTETAGMNSMVEWHGDPDEDTPYVLASDYDKLERELRVAKDHVTLLKARVTHLEEAEAKLQRVTDETCRLLAKAIRSLKPSSDMVCVPREPTEAMSKVSALVHTCECGRRITQWGVNAWNAMLAAAQEKP